MRKWILLLALLLLAGTACAGALDAQALVDGWALTGDAPGLDWSAVLGELIVVTQAEAAVTAVEATCRIEGITPDALAAYTPAIAFNAVGTEYSYGVRLSPPEGTALPPYYVEISASFAANMLRYHVLDAAGEETVAIRFFSGPEQEIREQSVEAFWKERM